MKNSNTGRPPVKGFGPTVRGVRKLTLPVRDGQILPGDLLPYRPFATGSTVRIDVRDGHWMHAQDAWTIGTALGHCGALQIEGTWDGWENYTGQFGELHGLEVIASKIEEAARLQSVKDMEEWA